jgi:hypothetical protein
MAKRILNRRDLRKRAEEAEPPAGVAAVEAEEAAAVATVPTKRARLKAATAPKAKKPRKAKTPPRQRARWGVFDGGMKQIAIFDYNQRAAADEKLADLLATMMGTHFLQIVKEPMPEAAAEVAALA